MKILKISLGVIAALVAIFFLLGVFTPKVSYSTEVEVNKSLNESWAVFMDESKASQWVEGLEGMELLSGTKNEVGATSKITIVQNGETMEMTEEVMAIKEMEQYALKFEMDVMTNQVDIKFAAKDDNTTIITTNAIAEGKGMFMRSMFALMKGAFKDQNDKMYNRLKEEIEANTTDYFPEPVLEAAADAVESAASDSEQ